MLGSFQIGTRLHEGPDPIHNRVTWVVDTAPVDEKKSKSLNIREQLNSFESDLSETQGDVEFLKREHSKVAFTLKKVLERLDSEVWSQTCAANSMWKHEMSNLYEAQEEKVKRYVTTSVNELKQWAGEKMSRWDDQKNHDALEEARQTAEQLRVESNKLHSKLEAMTHAAKKDLATMEDQVKKCLEDHAAALKGQMRTQLAIVNAEMKHQRNDLEREKNTRETGYKHLMLFMEMKSKPALPRQSMSTHISLDPPVMDNVAKRVANLASKLEAEVAHRAGKIRKSDDMCFPMRSISLDLVRGA